jgi:hypothetical protein
MLFYGLLLVVNVAQTSQPDFALSYINTHLQALLPGDRTDTAGVLYYSGIGAIVSLAIAAGLWFLADPARWGLLVVLGIPIGRGLFQAASVIATDPDKLWKTMGDIFWFELLAYALLILYMFRPDVQIAFSSRDRYNSPFVPKKGTNDYGEQ